MAENFKLLESDTLLLSPTMKNPLVSGCLLAIQLQAEINSHQDIIQRSQLMLADSLDQLGFVMNSRGHRESPDWNKAQMNKLL